MLEYKGYRGHAEFDDEAGLLHGEVLDTRDVITFQGTTVRQLEKAFRESVDDYLEFCRERGEEPDKPFTGRLMVRLPPELHRSLHVQARLEKKSLNQLIRERLEEGKPTRSLQRTSTRRSAPRAGRSAPSVRPQKTSRVDEPYVVGTM